MPNPSSVSSTQINTELGNSSTAELSLNDGETRDLAYKLSGQISYGDCRWGINFPALAADEFNASIRNYTGAAGGGVLFADVNQFGDENLGDTSITNTIEFELNSDGTFSLECGSSADGGTGSNSDTFTGTWLTSGVNSDYTARIDLDSGSFDVGTTGTDLSLSTTRTWRVEVLSAGVYEQQVADGTLIIKDSGGTTLFSRPIYFECSAEIAGP